MLETINSVMVVLCWFAGFIIHQKFNISYRLKRLFKLKLSKEYKLIDCYPCFSFWLALGLSFNPITALTVYMIAILIDRK